jgi:hypothetical protein
VAENEALPENPAKGGLERFVLLLDVVPQSGVIRLW